METRCEHCGQDCWIEDGQAGESVVCPWCERSFIAKEPTEHSTQLGSLVDLLLTEMPTVASAVNLEPAKRKAARDPGNRRMTRRLLTASIGCVAFGTVAAAFYRGVRWVADWFAARSIAAKPTVPDAGTEEWRPNAAVREFLGKPKSVEEFVFNPPEGFTAFNVLREPDWVPHDAHFVGLQWEGPLGPKAQMRCWIVKFGPAEPLQGGLKEALDRFFGWLPHHGALIRLSHEQPEIGKINGEHCVRAAFTGQYRPPGATKLIPRHGVVYVLLAGDRQICLFTLYDPAAQDDGVTMDASWMTWRRR